MKASPTTTADVLREELVRLGNGRRAADVARFFKCGEGEYGEGDRFLGLTVPQVRAAARKYRALSLAELQTLLDSEWHEVRLASLVILVERSRRASGEAERAANYAFYLRNLKRGRINNWDLVDVSCEHVVGAHLFDRDRAPLYAMAKSAHLWTRRVSIISTFHFIRRGQWKDTLALAELLLPDKHDLIHKAVGWMLREVGKRASEPALLEFLEQHAATMPRTMLRYAIERLTPRQREHYLGARQRAAR